ncbi:unnamed protein product [Musa acuminata var. zebrina]
MNRAWFKRASVNSSAGSAELGCCTAQPVPTNHKSPLFAAANTGFVCFLLGFLAEATMDNSSELQAFLKGQKAMIGQMVGKLTDQCWDKCISGTPGSKFSSKDSACLSNCARRFMDMSMLIMKKLQSMQ